MKSKLFASFSAILFLCMYIQTVHGDDGHFFGGSMSYMIEDPGNGSTAITVSLITGWILGKGPCWVGCNKNDIGRSTIPTRQLAMSSDKYYFGKFTIDYTPKGAGTIDRDMEELNPTPAVERVIDVSENAEYEQEIQTFSFLMPNYTDTFDINYDGSFWRNLTLQGGSDRKWHFQTRVSIRFRNDTASTNRCPQSISRPFYRIKLDQMGIIRLPAIDDDGDFIKCVQPDFVAAGDLSVYKAPNVTIHENCTVQIDATRENGFRDDTWIAIPVSVADYPRKPVQYGDDLLYNSQYNLCSTSQQFVVQVLENLITPEFVDPTLEGNHEFIMYADTTWRTEIYALASENTTIDSFTAFGLKQENLTFSTLLEDPRRERVVHASMQWQPLNTDLGRHIACVQAIDSTGVESAEQRCFILHVQADAFNHSTTITPGKPYFVDIPSPEQFVNCKMKATCVVPLYVKCNQTVIDIHVKDSYIEEYNVGPIETVVHNGENLYKADLFFAHSIHGQEKLCLYAKDSDGIESETVCISSNIEPPDPCISSPCNNSGVCVADKTTGGYRCRCPSKFIGRHCETKHDACTPNPCLPRGGCYIEHGIQICYCKRGYTGKYCEIDVNDCKTDSCNYHGTCTDIGVRKFRCDCFNRYNDTRCDNDKCPDEDPSLFECPATDCHKDTCHRNGICTEGGNCTCSSGYTGSSCNISVCDISGSITEGIKLISPSLKDGSILTCYIKGDTIQPCNTRVYVATSSGSAPTINVVSSLDVGDIIVGPVTISNDYPGKTGIYSTDISMSGNVENVADNHVCIKASLGSQSTNVCLELKLTPDPLSDANSLQNLQKDARVRFEEPSLKDNSRIVCYIGQPCTLQLYTSFSSNQTCNTTSLPSSTGSVTDSCGVDDVDNDSGLGYECCEDVISSTNGVTVFPAHARGLSCVTEVSISYTTPGEKHICFQSGLIDYQQVCYTVGVYDPNSDPCENSQCQNGGHCFHKDHDGYRCICTDKYYGENCEKGPCKPEDDHCSNDAYCHVNDGNTTCICKAGYADQQCATVSATDQQSVGYPAFTDTARPSMYTCVLHQTCSLALMVSGIAGQSPLVTVGYVSPSLTLGEIKLTARSTAPNSFIAGISLKTSELGIKDTCLQTKDVNKINRDEVCFKVNVIANVESIFGQPDKPHFTFPSLPTNTEVVCSVDEPCHVVYYVTPGTGHESECVSYNVKSMDEDFVNYNVFPLGDKCVPGLSNTGEYAIDVSVTNTVDDISEVRSFCVQLGIQGSNIQGEERCFSVNVTTQEKTGCQNLHCEHGFCDGHESGSPVCYCQNGFSGLLCDKAQVGSAFTGSQTLVSDFSIVSVLKCQVGELCAIPFKSLTKPGVIPDVSLGYTDPHMIVDQPVIHTSTSKPLEHIGYVSVSSDSVGTYITCLQVTTNGKVDDEQCVKVTFIDSASGNSVDETKPYFLIPTIPSDSTVLCRINEPCHLDMYFTNGDKFEATGECPVLVDVSPEILSGLHIFESIYTPRECNTDITYVPHSLNRINTVCFKLILPGKKGEKRCYDIKVVSDITKEVVSPCKSSTCENDGKCVGNPDISMTSGICVCKSGFYDDSCHTAVNTVVPLQGVENILGQTTGPVHFNSLGGIPETVVCSENSSCCVYVPYYSNGNQRPIVEDLGDLTYSTNESITIDPVTGQRVLVQCVSGPSGNHSICFQTTTNGTQDGVNIDEVCVTVNISAESRSTVEKEESHFKFGFSNGTSVTCKPVSTCHIPVITSANGSSCLQVHECGDGVQGLHVFETTKSTETDDCITDVALRTGNDSEVEMCVSAGKSGETMHMVVHIDNKLEFGPCQKKHCLNGGRCKGTSSYAECVCPAGYNGTLCEENIDDCTTNPCQNNGTCIDGINEYTCVCLPGFNGTDCEIDIDECVPNYCENNGTCIDGINSYTCNCVTGFTDRNCTTNIDDCATNPCQNNGTCIDGINEYTCHCLAGFNGTDCEIDIDECLLKPCTNNATCNDGINEYTCVCMSGFNGTNCDKEIDECESDPCQNGASCIDGINEYTCTCLPGFNGTDCGIDIDECQSSPCKNNATCVEGVNNYTCTCESGFNGANCETVIATTESPTSLASTTEAMTTTVEITTTKTPSTTSPPTCGSRTHDGVVTSNQQLPPAFIEYTIPEIIRCTVNKSCPILLPVDGQPGNKPNVQHGHYDLGLNMKPIAISSKRGIQCDITMPRCPYEATITVIPTEVKLYKYCVQTTDNHMINADELCYRIQGVPENEVTTLLSFVYPPTLPDNSTMSCPNGETCHYQIEVKKQSGICNLNVVNSQLDPGAVKLSQLTNTSTSCKYDIALTTPTDKTGHKSFCLEAKPGEDPACLNVNIKDTTLGHQETCYTLHCTNGGFCDSVADAPSACLCKPGFGGKQCEIRDSCGLSAPDTITCSNHQNCEISFVVSGSTPTFDNVGDGAEISETPIGTEHIVSVKFPTAGNASKICIDVNHGVCKDRMCTTVFFDPNSTPGVFSAGQLQYMCEPNSDCFVTATTQSVGNKCPDVLIHKDTTVASYHVFKPLQDGNICKSTIAVTGNTTSGENQRLCLHTENGLQQCIGIKLKSGQDSCSSKAATDHARKMVDTGYASCSCVFNGKKLNIIKKRPAPDPETLYKAAGFGAGGMLGTIFIGVVIYAIVSKAKSEPKKPGLNMKEKPRPSPRIRHKVHPHRRTHFMF